MTHRHRPQSVAEPVAAPAPPPHWPGSVRGGSWGVWRVVVNPVAGGVGDAA